MKEPSVVKTMISLMVLDPSATTTKHQEVDRGKKQLDVNKDMDYSDALINNKTTADSGGRQSRQLHGVVKKVFKRTTSCPSGRAYLTTAVPWSLEWVQPHKNIVTGDGCQLEVKRKNSNPSDAHRTLKKKGSGHLRHCAQNLMRIARLSEKDRGEVLCALCKTHNRRKVISEGSKDKVNIIKTSSQSGSQA